MEKSIDGASNEDFMSSDGLEKEEKLFRFDDDRGSISLSELEQVDTKYYKSQIEVLTSHKYTKRKTGRSVYKDDLLSAIRQGIEITSSKDIGGVKFRARGKWMSKMVSLKDGMSIIFVINNATIYHHGIITFLNSENFRIHKSPDPSNLSGCTVVEVFNMGAFIRAERHIHHHMPSGNLQMIKTLSEMRVRLKEPFSFYALSANFPDKLYDLFELAESVELIDKKWRYLVV